MTKQQLTQTPVASTGMLIRKPAAEVFRAFIDPEVTKNFWFTKGSGVLEAGKDVTWEWEMYGLTIPVKVKAVEPHQRLVVEWGDPAEGMSEVEWRFTPHEGGTFVSIENRGFPGSGDEQVEKAVDSAQGFSFVLAGLKAYLEHGIRLSLIADRHPQGIDHDCPAE